MFSQKSRWFQRALALSFLLLLLSLMFLLPGDCLGYTLASNDTIQVWQTNPADQSKLLQRQPDILFGPDSGAQPFTIDVNAGIKYQQMDGFGASLTDSSAWLITNTLNTSQRGELLNNLFNPTTGIGLSFLRQPMGASDFSNSGNYSYDDMPAGQADPTLAHFSIAHDQAYMIPLLKQIKTLNPALKIMATPWSPPGWMKTTNSMIGGTLNADNWWSVYELNAGLTISRANWIATAFSDSMNDTPSKAIDGSITTRWSSGLPQAPNNQWFQIDMGAVQTFNQIILDAGLSIDDYARGYQVFVSNDGTNWGSPVASGVGSPFTTITFALQTARYFRIVQTGTDTHWWSIHELYAGLILDRTNWVATAFSSPTICCQDDTPPQAIDGLSTTRWSSGVTQAPNNQWFQIDMGSAQAFNQIVMDAGSSNEDFARGYQVLVSNDGTNWGNPVASGAGRSAAVITFTSQTARYFRIMQTSTTSVYQPLADYFVRFAQAYEAEGLPIDFVSVQNEPGYIPPGYPGMGMSSSEQVNFIKNNLGPTLDSSTLRSKPKILVWDHNWGDSYPSDVLGDTVARSHVAGTAYHCYGGTVDSQSTLQAAYPSKGIWLSECSDYASKSFDQDFDYAIQTLTIGVVRNWGKSITHWNLALNENNGPQNGGCADCQGIVTINQSNHTVSYNAGYYALGHISRFVVPGAYRVDTNTYPGNIETVAFQNPNGSLVVIVLNSDTVAHNFMIRWVAKSFTYSLPAGAVATFIWSSNTVFLPLIQKNN